MHTKFCQILIATYNKINRYSLGHRKKIQILDITYRRFTLNCDICYQTNIIHHFKKIEPRFLGYEFVELRSRNNRADFLQ